MQIVPLLPDHWPIDNIEKVEKPITLVAIFCASPATPSPTTTGQPEETYGPTYPYR